MARMSEKITQDKASFTHERTRLRALELKLKIAVAAVGFACAVVKLMKCCWACCGDDNARF